MLCFQYEQTAKGTGCTVSGVCGKKPDTAHEQDVLTCEMIALAKVGETNAHVDLIVDGLFTTITNVSFDAEKIAKLTSEIKAERIALPQPEVLIQTRKGVTVSYSQSQAVVNL